MYPTTLKESGTGLIVFQKSFLWRRFGHKKVNNRIADKIAQSKASYSGAEVLIAVSEIEIVHCTAPKLLIRKEILRTVSNTGIYCSSDQVGTIYLE
jgi:hypothetical protein